jgi:hypothetical protein
MAGNQISTTVTAFNSKLGYNGISLSNRDNDSEPVIYGGSTVEISNSIFIFNSNESITGWSSITTGSTAYVKLTPAGTAGTQTVTAGWASTAPTYIAAKGGFYLSAGSDIRYVASAIKHSATEYGFKQKLMGENSTTTGGTIITEVTFSSSPTNGSDFIVHEPCLVYGKFDINASAGDNVYALIQGKVNGTYTWVNTTPVPEDSNVIAYVTDSLSETNILSLNPGTYRLYLFATATPTNTPKCTLYRAGRLTDVTQ